MSCKLIGPSDGLIDFEKHSNTFSPNYFIEKVTFFPYSKRVIQSFIVHTCDHFDSIFVDDEIFATYVPEVQKIYIFNESDRTKKK